MAATSRAAFTMARGIRSAAPTVNGITENLWCVRGALRFDQGMQVLYNHFAGKHVAEALSHPFFIEKEYWPEQPSPQFQLTEEMQCLSMVVRGSFMARDVSTHLDNTMALIRNERNPKEFALYNPITVNDATLGEVRKIIGEEGTVVQIIVPTRVAWQSVGEWALYFPDAEIACSGNVPPRFTKAGAQEVQLELERWKNETGWYERKREYEAKLEEDERVKKALEERNAANVGRRRSINTNVEGPLKRDGKKDRWDNVPTMVRMQQNVAPGIIGSAGITAPAMPYMAENRMNKDDAKARKKDFDLNRVGRSDVFSNASFADELDEETRKKVTKSEPVTQVRPDMPGMKKRKKAKEGAAPPQMSPEEREEMVKEAQELLKPDPAPADMADNIRILDPYGGHDVFGDGASRLLHISGDRATNEFALYHAPSRTLACTDLYHAGYADHDPMNTWLCRVWFKFQRAGNFKCMTTLPAYRRIQIEKHGDMAEMKGCVDDLTRAFPIDRILCAHGSQPVCETPVDFLREMYDLPPLGGGGEEPRQ